MDKNYIEEQMHNLKNHIKVNEDLKRELRASFGTKRKRKWKLAGIAAIAAIVCLVWVSNIYSPRVYIGHVNAASLKILNQVSFVDIGTANGDVAEYNGTVYNAVFGQGIYVYDSNGYYEIYNKEVNNVSVSSDGKRLAFSDGNLNIFDIETSTATVLLKSDEYSYEGQLAWTSYEQPAWSSDNKHIIFVKKVIKQRETHGFEVVESSICQINLENMDISKLTDGSSPSFAGENQVIVFERDGNIIRKDCRDGSEKIIDLGRFPSASPDGEYVTYVKTEKNEKIISSKFSMEENIDNVWIADVNFETKKKLTMNFVNYEEEGEEASFENDSDLPMSILRTGVYSYYNPKWSSDSKSIYVIKNNNKLGNMKLMRISFTESKLNAADTVANFIQALIGREEDYAKSLIKNPPDLLTVSNPRVVGYKIIGSGIEDERDYVETEIYWSYTAQPDFQVQKQKFYLSYSEGSYIIDEIASENVLTVGLSKDAQSVIMKKDIEQVLFNIKDIPASYLTEGDFRIASLAFNEESGMLVFSIQVISDDAQKASVKLLTYDLNSREFKFIDLIKEISGKKNVSVEGIIMDATGRYAAAKLFWSEEGEFGTSVFIYDLKNGTKADISSLIKNVDINSIHAKFWNREVLVLDLVSDGQTMSYLYDPGSRSLKSFSK